MQVELPQTRYARSGDVSIAYWTLGDGTFDLVYVPAFVSRGEMLVSSTVRDLVAGSGIAFRDRGVVERKGVPGEWRLSAVER